MLLITEMKGSDVLWVGALLVMPIWPKTRFCLEFSGNSCKLGHGTDSPSYNLFASHNRDDVLRYYFCYMKSVLSTPKRFSITISQRRMAAHQKLKATWVALIERAIRGDATLVIGECIKACHLRIIHGPIHP